MKTEFIKNLDELFKKYFHTAELTVLSTHVYKFFTENQDTNLMALGITSPLIMGLYYMIVGLKNNNPQPSNEEGITINLTEKQIFINTINDIICSSIEKVLRELGNKDKDTKKIQGIFQERSAKEINRDFQLLKEFYKDYRSKLNDLIDIFIIDQKINSEKFTSIRDILQIGIFHKTRDNLKKLMLEQILKDNKEIDPILEKFDSSFIQLVLNNKNLQNFIRFNKYVQTNKMMETYLSLLLQLKNKSKSIDGLPLDEYYVEQKAIWLPYIIREKNYDSYKMLSDKLTWDMDEEEILIHKFQKWDQKAQKMFMKGIREDIVIGAYAGIGKTSFALTIAEKSANEYLKRILTFNDIISTNTYNGFFPIYIDLSKGLKTLYSDDNDQELDYLDIDVILKELFNNKDNKDNNLLFICDGLDEYHVENKTQDRKSFLINELKKKIKNNINNFTGKQKFLITTRLDSGMIEKNPSGNYVRLLRFDDKQVNDFFTKYFRSVLTKRMPNQVLPVSIGIDRELLDYDILVNKEKFNINKKIVSTPLYTWTLSYLLSNFNTEYAELFKKIKLNSEINNMNKNGVISLIFLALMHSVIAGKHQNDDRLRKILERLKVGENEYYFCEKWIIRKIAAINSLYKNIWSNKSITLAEIKKSLNNFAQNESDRNFKKKLTKLISNEENLKIILDIILTSYFKFDNVTTIRDNSQNVEDSESVFTFIHNAMGEYYLAEYYLENLLSDEHVYNRLNVGIIDVGEKSDLTLQFLEGLIYILFDTNFNKFHDNEIVKKFMENIDVKNYHFKQKWSELIKKLKEEVKKEDLVIPILKDKLQINNNQNVHEISLVDMWLTYSMEKPKNVYESIWVHRWFSLYLLSHIQLFNIDNTIDNTQENNNNKNPPIENIVTLMNYTSRFIPFYLKKLMKVDLSKANLSSADLSRADLSKANLSSADLSRADLSKANLSSAHIVSADLSGANLSSADLSGANLSSADLSGANLSSADLSGANLSSADLSGANLSSAYIVSADLSGANLSSAYLSLADLSHANLSGANLSNALTVSANLSSVHLERANLLRANLSGANLLRANLSFCDLLDINLSDTNLSNADFSGADLSGANLSHANFSGANFSGTNFSNSIIINPFFDNIRISDANFSNAIIDDPQFLDYITKFTNKVPSKINNKNELKLKLNQIINDDKYIEILLIRSKL